MSRAQGACTRAGGAVRRMGSAGRGCAGAVRTGAPGVGCVLARTCQWEWVGAAAERESGRCGAILGGEPGIALCFFGVGPGHKGEGT